MTDAVIVSTARTPIGRAFRGAFNMTHGGALGGHVIKHALDRAKVEAGSVEDVVLGCGFPEGGTGGNIARVASIHAGVPVTAAAMTVNRFCSSGLQAIAIAANSIRNDGVPVAVAGGLESISLVAPNMNAKFYKDPWVEAHKSLGLEAVILRQRGMAWPKEVALRAALLMTKLLVAKGDLAGAQAIHDQAVAVHGANERLDAAMVPATPAPATVEAPVPAPK